MICPCHECRRGPNPDLEPDWVPAAFVGILIGLVVLVVLALL